jgi:predicted ATPase
LLGTITNYLKTKHLLLTLDNCEHLLAACREWVGVLLLACPNLQVLATSREPLARVGELTWLVPALSLPDAVRLSKRDDHLVSEL